MAVAASTTRHSRATVAMCLPKTASILALAALASCSSGGPPYFIPGSATLPTCTEPPAFDLNGSWSDAGHLTFFGHDACDVSGDEYLRTIGKR